MVDSPSSTSVRPPCIQEAMVVADRLYSIVATTTFLELSEDQGTTSSLHAMKRTLHSVATALKAAGVHGQPFVVGDSSRSA